jgi:hypothetical protein
MRISSKREYLWSTRQQRYILLLDVSEKWTGPISLAKGASAAQENLANEQAAFYQQLTQDYSTQFAGQQAILNTLQSTLNPIISAGPNQMGFSAAQLANLNAGAVQGTGQQYAGAKKALAEQQSAAGGGNIPLPSGVASQQQAQLASSSAATASGELMDIQQKGYQQGYNQYEAAIGQLGGVANMMNPTGYASAANTSGQDAFSSATEVQKMNNAASPWNFVGGILGGAAGAGIDAMTGGLGGMVGNTSSPISGGGELLNAGDYGTTGSGYGWGSVPGVSGAYGY